MPEPLGSTTYTVFLYGVEEDKLHLEFEVNTAVSVYRGMPVKLAGDGEKITPIANSDDPSVFCIGYCIHDGVAGDLVTVAMRAITVIWAEAYSAMNPGPVRWYDFSTANADNSVGGFNRYEDGSVTYANHIGWSLDAATDQGDKIRVALIG